jgi:hypothetical protein
VTRMNCAKFETHFDAYVDAVLDDATMVAARGHLAVCPDCNQAVSRFQQTRCLLSTAVAEVAAAVDVSGMWERVEAELGPAPRRGRLEQGYSGPGFGDRVREWVSENILPVFSPQGGAFVGAGAAAAIVVSLMISGPDPLAPTAGTQVAQAPTVSAKRVSDQRAPRLAPVRLASTEGRSSRDSSVRIDRIDAGPGRAVSTWVQPRTGAQVIWVSDRGSASALVRTAEYTR